MKYIYKLSLIVLLTCSKISAQNLLTLEEAISKALDNNWTIKVSEMQITAAENQIYKANAGMVPIIDLNANMASSLNQVNQRFFDGRVINRFGRVLSPNANLSLAYTIYDGKRMFTIMERLKSTGQMSQIQSKAVIQNTISNLMQQYYNVQRLQRTLSYLNIIIKYYEEQLNITEERWIIGRGSKLDYLQSKTDLNIQKSNLALTEGQLKTSKIGLNRFLGKQEGIDFEVEKYLYEDRSYNLNDLTQDAKLKNQEFLLIKKSEEINLLNQKEAASFKMPRISLTSSFGYNFNSNNAGLIALNQSVGLNVGIAATWRVFDGQQINRNIQLSKINSDIIKLQKEDLLNNIQTDIYAAYSQFETDKGILKIELENNASALENLEISLEKFKLGASTILELNDAQTRFNTTLNRLVNAEFNIKISELNLLRESGRLVE